ncbi:MAG: AAA family ATPase [Kiloniellales bacterium]
MKGGVRPAGDDRPAGSVTEDHVVEDQSEAAAFLSDPATHGGSPVDRIDTHGAMVFLAGDRAYKLKRAVAFPYMDFSTLERRHAACRAEVRLNRRTAPEFYLGVLPIVRGPKGGLRFGRLDDHRADAVDWVVVMRRFEQSSILDRVARDGELTPQLMRELARVIAAFHQAAEPHRDAAAARQIRAVVAENFAELAQDPVLFQPGRLRRLRRLTETALNRVWSTLCDRERTGFVRRCHGDLHLRNVCLIDGRPTLFDAIEFNDAFAVIDVLYDLAFLVMDLDHRGLDALANTLVNEYLGVRHDYAGLKALPLFLSMRAAVRAKVAVSIAAVQTDPSAALEWRREARRFFDRAVAYVDVSAPRLVAIGGLSGTGKSALAHALAPRFRPVPGAVILRSDVIRKELAGVKETTRLAADNYRPPMNRRVYREITRRAGRALDAGYPAIADAVYARPKQREAIERLARDRGLRFDGLWLRADPATLIARVDERGEDASDATGDVVCRQLDYDLGRVTWTRIDAGKSLARVATAAWECLGQPAPQATPGVATAAGLRARSRPR